MKIFGQVLDVDGLPMSLANVAIVTEGNSLKIGDVADLDGNFVLENTSITPDSEFRISYIGYVPQLFKASELQGRKIILEEDITALKEVVITPEKVPSKKQKFVKHLNDHKFVYAGLGGLLGVLLIVKALKK